MVVNQQAQPHDRPRPHLRAVQKHESERPGQMRREVQKAIPFLERLPHQPEFEVLEVPEAAVNELRRPRGGAFAQIAFFAQENRKAAARRVPRDRGSVDAASYDEKVKRLREVIGVLCGLTIHGESHPHARLRTAMRPSSSR